MIGNNELMLNEATLIEALQEYLDKRYTPNVKVSSVEQKDSGYNKTFLVKTADKDKAQ